MVASIKELLAFPEPLSDEVLKHVLSFHEETAHVDFKLDFHPTEEREWLEITKDVMAFANTEGGYLAFGVRDKTYDIVGVADATARVLSDPNLLMQKINRYIEPHITGLRSRSISMEGRECVLLFIPRSYDCTHIVSKDASFKFPSGAEKVVLQQGTSYVRRVAGNHLVDARDLDGIIARRIEHFKSSLLDKIARVVESPPGTDILVVSKVATDEPHRKFIIDNAPDALAVKGMSFTVSPPTIEHEISAWVAMTSGDPSATPGPAITWKWYRLRKALKLTPEQRIHAAMYCLANETPAFYWLQGCKAAELREALRNCLSRKLDADAVSYVLTIAAFLGRKFHASLVREVNEGMLRRVGKPASFPDAGPRSLLSADSVAVRRGRTWSTKDGRGALEAELDDIAASVKKSGDVQPELQLRWRAATLDCYLYAQDDQYT